MCIANRAKLPTNKGAQPPQPAPSIAAKGGSAPAAFTHPSTPSITLSDEPFGLGFDVDLSHPADGDHRGREFHGYPNALAYARVLRLEFGLPIVDRTGNQS